VTEQQLKIAVVGAGGKMGMRVSDNLQRSSHDLRYVENSSPGQQRTIEAGRTLTDIGSAVRYADVVILAVPDIALGPVSEQLVPQLQPGTIVLV
jgi:D-apionate oxidoisomerase